MGTTTQDPLIGIVGPCGAGKSTLASNLTKHYSRVRAIAQEHSYVQEMWRRITDPDILVYLHASYVTTIARRQLNWTEEEYRVELDRLKNARENADIYVDTDELDPPGVTALVMAKLAALVSRRV